MVSNASGYGFLRPALRGLPIIIAAMVTGVLIANKYLNYTTPMYESTAKIKLADVHDGVSNSNLYKDFDVFVHTNKIGAEVEMLKSRVLVEKVVKTLDIGIAIFRVGELHKTELYNQSPFIMQAQVTDPAFYNKPCIAVISKDSLITIQTPFGEKIQATFNRLITTKNAVLIFRKNENLIKQRPQLQVNDNYEFVVQSEESLVSNIIANLDVMAVDKDIPVLRISYTSSVPQKAADVVNALSAVYITDYVDEKFKSADTTAGFLEHELKSYSAKLSGSENAIEDYRDNKNIINIRQETETDLRKIADMKKQLASLQMNLTAIDSLNNYIQNGKENFLELAPNFEAFTDLLSTELVKKTKELQREKRDLLLHYTPENEKVKVVDDKITDINNYFVESIRNTRYSLQTQYDNLRQSIADAEKQFVGLPSREKNMTILERNFGMNEQIYRFLSEKKTEAEIAKAATISFHRIISEGEVPINPVSPNYPIIKIMSAILGMLSGIFLVYGVHALKGRVNNEETINRISATPVSALIPYCKNEMDEEAFFRNWALELELKKQLSNGNIITLSSFSAREGKAFLTRHLAKEVAQLDKRVAIIDAEEILTGELHKPSLFKAHLATLQRANDVVVIKNSDIDKNASALMPIANAHLNLFVLDSRRTRKKRVLEIDIMTEKLAFPNMQFVLNRAGYNPSLFTQVKNALCIIKKKFRK